MFSICLSVHRGGGYTLVVGPWSFLGPSVVTGPVQSSAGGGGISSQDRGYRRVGQGYPPGQDRGTPPPPGQDRLYREQYASCGHAGGLSCYIIGFFVFNTNLTFLCKIDIKGFKKVKTKAASSGIWTHNSNYHWIRILTALPTQPICQSMAVSDFQTLIKSCSIDSRNDPTSV